jgi:hypothetical protein
MDVSPGSVLELHQSSEMSAGVVSSTVRRSPGKVKGAATTDQPAPPLSAKESLHLRAPNRNIWRSSDLLYSDHGHRPLTKEGRLNSSLCFFAYHNSCTKLSLEVTSEYALIGGPASRHWMVLQRHEMPSLSTLCPSVSIRYRARQSSLGCLSLQYPSFSGHIISKIPPACKTIMILCLLVIFRGPLVRLPRARSRNRIGSRG